MGLYHTELKNTCLLFIPKEPQHESEIKATLDHQLVSMRKINTDPSAPSHNMAGFRSIYSFETEGKSTKTGKM